MEKSPAMNSKQPTAAALARLENEATRILRLAGSEREAFHIIERQFGVLVLRTQVLLSLSGIVITVTGFSGRAIAQTSATARLCIALGIATVLLAAITAIAGVLRLRWLTELLMDDPHATILHGLRLRNTKSRYLSASSGLFVVGFALYVAAIVQLLLAARPGL